MPKHIIAQVVSSSRRNFPRSGMRGKVTLSLTPKELSLLRAILGFVEAGEVSGGPLDAETPQQRSANLRVFNSLCNRVSEDRVR
jgi:hypothetical protein